MGEAAPVCDPDGKLLVEQCLAADVAARARFQERYGPLIYRFVSHSDGSHVEPGDFYLYAFENDRLYRRLRSYRGIAPLSSFLRAYALPDLLGQLRAMRANKAIETVPIDHERIAAPPDDAHADTQTAAPHREWFERLGAEKQLLIKLLYIEDFTLEPVDIQQIARRSGRSVRAVIEHIEQARDSVRERETTQRGRIDEAESAAHWILRYERRLAEVREQLEGLSTEVPRARRLRGLQLELERKRRWRHEQRERALADGSRAQVTLRYRDIAEILNQPLGSVSAQITRLRQELARLAGRGEAK